MCDEEEWRDIDAQRFPHYQVSNLGRIRSGVGKRYKDGRNYEPRILKPARRMIKGWSKKGYLFINLCSHGEMWGANIHYLVCTAFHGPKPGDKDCVAHYDGNPENNRADNLRWATYKENTQDAIRHGTLGRSRLTEDQKNKIREFRASGGRLDEIAKKFHISDRTIRKICASIGPVGHLRRPVKQHTNESERRREMRQMREAGATLDAIGRHFGVSRERIRQLLYHASPEERAIVAARLDNCL